MLLNDLLCQVKKKYNITLIGSFLLSLREKELPPPNFSQRGPNGYWFLGAAALSNSIKPSDNYVLAVYRC